jgi:hypothetical protein
MPATLADTPFGIVGRRPVPAGMPGASCQYHRSAEFIPQSACISPQLRNEFRAPFPG